MSKFGTILLILVMFGILMLMASVVVPDILVPMANTANATIASTSNMSNYPGTSAALVSTPWTVYIALPVVALVAIIVVLRGPSLADQLRDYIARMGR